MNRLEAVDDQAIDSRFGESVWLTSFITPQNPDIMLKYQALTEGLLSQRDRIVSLWEYVANIPYREIIRSKLVVNGRVISQKDTWFYPAETMKTGVANCANKSFLLASLLLNELPESKVSCVMGRVTIDGIGAHAWVEVECSGKDYLLETTLPQLEEALIPTSLATAYEPVLCFSDKRVYGMLVGETVESIINARFGFCPIPFLQQYLCERCLEL